MVHDDFMIYATILLTIVLVTVIVLLLLGSSFLERFLSFLSYVSFWSYENFYKNFIFKIL